MIRLFKWEYIEALSKGQHVRKFFNIAKVARCKPRQLEIAGWLDDLRMSPGNSLEALKGDRSGKFRARINEQWRA